MSIDIFRTFAPLKQTSSTLVLAILELTTLFMNHNPNKVKNLLDEAKFHSDRASEYETMMDLMDLYTQFGKSTKVGPNFDLAKLMDIKINISKRMAKDGYHRYVGFCEKCMEAPEAHPVTPGSAKSPATNNSLSGSGSVRGKPGANDRTVRYVFDAEQARKEKTLVAEYHEDEYEEYEVEVEEPITPEPTPRPPPLQNGRGAFSHRGQGHHPGHGYGGYSRGGHMSYSDRSRGRGGYRGYH
jgi:CTD kinase subunit beta